MTIRATCLLLVTLALFSMTGCEEGNPEREAVSQGNSQGSGSGGGGVPPSIFFYVDAAAGSDINSGSAAAPFKTITHALSLATSGATVQVLPGQYNVANGEAFPINVPAGVSLVGDLTNKGANGVFSTLVSGSGPIPGTIEAALVASSGASISGLWLYGATPGGGNPGMVVVLDNDGVTLSRNTISNAQSSGIYVRGSSNHVISANNVQDNLAGVGIAFVIAGINTRVENNLVTNNDYGIEQDVLAGDLGGGPAGSVGGNTIYCNLSNDLWTNTGGTLYAMNNIWDHNPPSGNDYFNGGGATLVLTGFSNIGGCASP